MAKKKKKKHNIEIPPRGPQSKTYLKKRKKKFNITFGLSPSALKELGYRYKLSRFHKILFVVSICAGMIPFWFILEKKEYAQSRWRAVRAFMLNLFLWIMIVLVVIFWHHIAENWNSLFRG